MANTTYVTSSCRDDAGRVLSTDGNNPASNGWGGITVTSGRVTGMGRVIGSGFSLAGTLPPELGDLSELRNIAITGSSSLTGPIPEELGMLSELTALVLHSNGLTGSVPSELGNLTNLRGGGSLVLRGNALTGCIPTSVADDVPSFGLSDINPQSDGSNLAVCAAAIDNTSPQVGGTCKSLFVPYRGRL